MPFLVLYQTFKHFLDHIASVNLRLLEVLKDFLDASFSLVLELPRYFKITWLVWI